MKHFQLKDPEVSGKYICYLKYPQTHSPHSLIPHKLATQLICKQCFQRTRTVRCSKALKGAVFVLVLTKTNVFTINILPGLDAVNPLWIRNLGHHSQFNRAKCSSVSCALLISCIIRIPSRHSCIKQPGS